MLERELDYNRDQQRLLYDEISDKFNEKQALYFREFVLAAETDPSAAHFFIQGPGGTRKTFLYKGVAAYFRSQGKVVLCVASSDIAALLLPGGRTAHSRFRIPIDIFADSSCNVKKNTKISQLLRRADIIIWDEVPMQHRHCFEAVDRTLRDIRENDVLFGGIPTLFGDFAQILPVVRRGKRPQIVEACLQRSPIWPQLSLRCLTENMRVAGLDRENRDFVSWLQDLSYDPAFQGFIAPPPSINTTSAIADFYTGVYPDDLLRNAAMDPTVFADRCILSALNKGVNDINRIMIRKYPGELKEFHGATTAEDAENAPPLPPELLQELDFPSIPPANLELKIGAPVILLRNMDPESGHSSPVAKTMLWIHIPQQNHGGTDFELQVSWRNGGKIEFLQKLRRQRRCILRIFSCCYRVKFLQFSRIFADHDAVDVVNAFVQCA